MTAFRLTVQFDETKLQKLFGTSDIVADSMMMAFEAAFNEWGANVTDVEAVPTRVELQANGDQGTVTKVELKLALDVPGILYEQVFTVDWDNGPKGDVRKQSELCFN
jgi:hypothetical protein